MIYYQPVAHTCSTCATRHKYSSSELFSLHKSKPGQQDGISGIGAGKRGRVSLTRLSEAPKEPPISDVGAGLWPVTGPRVVANPSQGQPHTALRDNSISKQIRPFKCEQQPYSGLREPGTLRGRMSPPVSRRCPRRYLSSRSHTPPTLPKGRCRPSAGDSRPPPRPCALRPCQGRRCPPCPSRPVPVPTTTTSNSVGRLSAILGGAVTRAPPAERAGAAEGVPAGAAPPEGAGHSGRASGRVRSCPGSVWWQAASPRASPSHRPSPLCPA